MRRTPRHAWAVLLAAACLSGCANNSEKSEEKSPNDLSNVPAGAPTGGDYVSTAMRARARANDKLGQAQEMRKEQIRELDEKPAGKP